MQKTSPKGRGTARIHDIVGSKSHPQGMALHHGSWLVTRTAHPPIPSVEGLNFESDGGIQHCVVLGIQAVPQRVPHDAPWPSEPWQPKMGKPTKTI